MKFTRTILFLLIFVFVSACNSTTSTPTSSPTNTPSPIVEATATSTYPAPTETATQPVPTAVKFDASAWQKMTAADKTKVYDTLPATSAEGYAKGNVSTVKDNLVIYRDAHGKAMGRMTC